MQTPEGVAVLVVSANWALGDGTLAAAAAAPHIGAWLQAVQRAAVRAGFGHDGSYRPISELQVVLAGDTFDCLMTAAWTGTLRPWHGGRAAADARRSVLVRAAGRGRRLLRALQRWARDGLPVPTADRRGRPVLGEPRLVPVRVALLAGDRDAWLEEAGAEAARCGLSIGHAWSSGSTQVRHGHEGDPCAAPGDGPRVGGRGWQPTLGESVAVGLVARFAAAIAVTAAAPACGPLLTGLAAAGPLALPAVFDAWLRTTRVHAPAVLDHHELILSQWRRSVDAWLRETIREPPLSPVGFAACDALARHFDAVARGRGRAGRGDVRDCLAPGPEAASGGPTALGHPPAPRSWTSGVAGVICLGAGLASGWKADDTRCDAPHASGPPVTVLQHGQEWRRLPVQGFGDDRPLVALGGVCDVIVDAA